MSEEIDKKAKSIVGNNLKKYRLLSGLSYRKLATEAFTDTSQILRIEKGEIACTISTLFKLAQALGIHPSKLLED